MLTTLSVPQASFPGQAAAPPGPADLLPMYVMHFAFRRDLRDFTAAVHSTPLADRSTWRALNRRWQRFSRILHLHHSGEDETLWPVLLQRVDAGGDATGRATLTAMEAEHGEIDPLLTACAAGFDRLAGAADPDTRAALAVRLAATQERLGHHLGHEESDAMALLQGVLTPAEWDAMHAEFGRHYTAADAVFALPWVQHQVPAELRGRVRAFLGSGAVAASVVLVPFFRLGERRAFRYANPSESDKR